jgi:hypothetical protein
MNPFLLVTAALLLQLAYTSQIYVLKCRYYTTHCQRVGKSSYSEHSVENKHLEQRFEPSKWRQTQAFKRQFEQQYNTIYYVGKTDNWDRRLAQHQRNEVPATRDATKLQLWCLYEDYQISPLDPSQAEDIMFMHMVKKVGMIISETFGLNVRGASFATRRRYNDEENAFIKRLIQHQKDRCFICSGEHKASKCNQRNGANKYLDNTFFRNIRNGRLVAPESSVRFLETLGEDMDNMIGATTDDLDYDSDIAEHAQ